LVLNNNRKFRIVGPGGSLGLGQRSKNVKGVELTYCMWITFYQLNQHLLTYFYFILVKISIILIQYEYINMYMYIFFYNIYVHTEYLTTVGGALKG